jgi:TrmH family RNA methyltransferase
VAEGLRIFKEIPREQIDSIFVSESFLKEEERKHLIDGMKYEVLTDEVFQVMSDTKTPQGILALVKQHAYTLEDLTRVPGPAFLMILENIQDPGNLGTIIRAGEGAGITGVLMNSTTADIYNPKVIRSTMGSVFRVPFAYSDDLAASILQLKNKGIKLYAAHLNGRNNYEKEDYTVDTGFLIGNEANGLTEDTAGLADAYIKIPMMGSVESLNAAVAASVLMFETARQRRG